MSDVLDTDVDDAYGISPDPIVRRAHKRFERCVEWESIARQRWLADYQFANGDSDNAYQWPDKIYTGRVGQDQPALTISKVRQHNLQIINDAKQKKSGIKYRPVGDGATVQAAEIFEGITRHIQDVSNAAMHRGQAIEFQVQAGLGFTRVVTKFEHDKTFDQEIYIRSVNDPNSCYLDPDCQELDGSDARYGFIFSDRARDAVETEYPQLKHKLTATNAVDGSNAGWLRRNTIREAEYYEVEEEEDELIGARDGTTILKSQANPKLIREWEKEAEAKGEELRRRPIVRKKLMWYKIIGDQVVAKEPQAGKTVPIIPWVGEVTVINNVLDRKGHTRALKDAQRMLNYNRPLALDTPLPTPNGWTTMGDIEPGDLLFDERGKPCRVKGVSPVFTDRKCYRVTFKDGTTIVADEGHPWAVERRGIRKSAGTEWLNETVETAQLRPGDDFIYANAPLDLGDLDFPVDPYLLGLWLGDGSSSKPELCGARPDLEEVRARLIARGHKVGDLRGVKDNHACYVTVDGLKDQLREAGVFQNKHIPPAYLRGSRAQREALLQGLMDTDGCFNPQCNQAIFVNCNLNIASGVVELLRSLGLRPKVTLRPSYVRTFPHGKTHTCRASLRVTFTSDPDQPTFLLSRKREAHERSRKTQARRTTRIGIKSVVEVPSVPVRCVCIDTDTHLFLAGEGMVPTHNSASVEFGALQSKTPYMGPARAVEGYETYWETANTENHAFLPYNDVTENGEAIQAPQRQEPPKSAPVFLEGAQAAERDMMIASGQYEAELGAPSNEVSGRAINERQRQGDRATYHFIDCQAIAIRREGAILLELIPEVYDTARVKRILGEDGSENHVQIDPKCQGACAVGPDDMIIFNPNVGTYAVVSDVGPDYATQRQEAFAAIVQVITQAPGLLDKIGDLLFKMADFPLADEIAERLKPGMDPQAQQAVAGLQQQLRQANTLLGEAMQALSEERLKVKSRDSDNTIKAYEADTHRLTAIKDMIPLDPADMQALIHETVRQALQDNLGPIVGELMQASQMDHTPDGPPGASGSLPYQPPPVGDPNAALRGG